MVSQDPFLFDASVKENLLLAEPSALETDLENALKVAHAWNFVSELPDGWDTLIGEKGVRLSMGENKGLPWLGQFSRLLRSLFWTKLPPAWTPRPREVFKMPWRH